MISKTKQIFNSQKTKQQITVAQCTSDGSNKSYAMLLSPTGNTIEHTPFEMKLMTFYTNFKYRYRFKWTDHQLLNVNHFPPINSKESKNCVCNL